MERRAGDEDGERGNCGENSGEMGGEYKGGLEGESEGGIKKLYLKTFWVTLIHRLYLSSSVKSQPSS